MTGSRFIVIEEIKHYTTNKTREREGLVESARGGYRRFPKIAHAWHCHDVTAFHARQIQTRLRSTGARRLPEIGLSERPSLLPASALFLTGDLARSCEPDACWG